MTTRPELRLGKHLVPGLIAVVLFGIMVLTFVNAPLGDPAGFDEATTIQNESLQSENPTGDYDTVSDDGQTYAVAYDSEGSEAANVSIADTPDANVEFVEVDSDGDGQANQVYAVSRTTITENIGYLLFDIDVDQRTAPGETFLVAFIVMGLVLDAALDGAVTLARRDEGGEVVTALGLFGSDESTDTVAADGGSDHGGDN